jgi:hypothetical protein
MNIKKNEKIAENKILVQSDKGNTFSDDEEADKINSFEVSAKSLNRDDNPDSKSQKSLSSSKHSQTSSTKFQKRM